MHIGDLHARLGGAELSDTVGEFSVVEMNGGHSGSWICICSMNCQFQHFILVRLGDQSLVLRGFSHQ